MTFEQTISLWRGISFLGDWHLIVVLTLAVLIVLLNYRRRYEALAFGSVLLVTECITFLLKVFFHHPRPLDGLIPADDPYSFPSGHAVIAVAFYGMLATLLMRHFSRNSRARIAIISTAGALMMLIGASRIVLGVHYPEDVLFWYSLGALSWVIFFIKTADFRTRRN